MLTWAYVWAIGDLSSSVSQSCMRGFGLIIWYSCGAFGRFSEAPLLHHSIFQSVSPWFVPRDGRWDGKSEGDATSHYLDDSSTSHFGSRVPLFASPGSDTDIVTVQLT